MSTEINQDALQLLIDKEAIRTLMMRYSRSMDRRDRDLARSIYWPEASDDHIIYRGNVEGFLDHAFAFMAEVPTAHFLGNMLIDLQDPTHAFCETYYIAYHDMPGEMGREDWTLWGRYLDRLEKRGSEWRIIARALTLDAYTVMPGSAAWDDGPFVELRTRGTAKPDDPLYLLHPLGAEA